MVLLSFNDLNQGARKPVAQRRAKAQCCNKRHARFSFIRTVTVGSGIAPDLLTLRSRRPSKRSRAAGLPGTRYRRWGIAPRPENNAEPLPTSLWKPKPAATRRPIVERLRYKHRHPGF
ncbi:hypothetical protein GCM10027276_03440 [Comamonas piscis]